MGQGRGRENYSASEDGETRSSHLKPISYRISRNFLQFAAPGHGHRLPKEGERSYTSDFQVQPMDELQFLLKPRWAEPAHEFCSCRKRDSAIRAQRDPGKGFLISNLDPVEASKDPTTGRIYFSPWERKAKPLENICAQKLPLHFGCSS